MKHLLTICLFVSVLSLETIYAQTGNVSFMLSGYGSVPVGDYGKNLGEEAKITRRFGFDFGNEVGLAKPGVGLGFELNTNMLVDGLGWIVTGRYLVNGTDPSAVETEFNR